MLHIDVTSDMGASGVCRLKLPRVVCDIMAPVIPPPVKQWSVAVESSKLH